MRVFDILLGFYIFGDQGPSILTSSYPFAPCSSGLLFLFLGIGSEIGASVPHDFMRHQQALVSSQKVEK